MIPLSNTICIVYLSYVPFGTDFLKSFLKSYKEHDAGIEHKLIILFNGYNEEKNLIPFIEILNQSSVAYSTIEFPEKFDISAYFFAAQQQFSDYFLFLNTYSQFLHKNWLLILFNALNNPTVGVVGCTAGWGAFGRDSGVFFRVIKNIYTKLLNNSDRSVIVDAFGKPTATDISFLKRVFIYCARKLNFSSKENPHLRTNAFMIKRSLFLSLQYQYPIPQFFFKWYDSGLETKFKTICFEHGIHSMSNQIWKKNLEILVVDKNGNTYKRSQWKESSTFWYGSQENLLISDNQTQFYQNADESEKAKRRYSAWNEI